MSDPITIERSDLFALVDRVAGKAIDETLKAVGIKAKDLDPSITQNQAVKMLKEHNIGIQSLRSAMFAGRVRWERTDMNRPHSRIKVKLKDVLKLINK